MYLFSTVNCSIVVSLDTTYDFNDVSEIIVSRESTINGNLNQFLWGSFNRFNIPLKFVQDSDASQINNWWDNNTSLVYGFDNQEYNVKIINSDRPIQSLQRPYNDVWNGSLILNVL